MKENLLIQNDSKTLKGLLDEINICIFTTNNHKERKQFFSLMPNAKVDEDGTIWFFANRKSRKINEIETNAAVHLLYTHPGKKNYVDVWGDARLIADDIKMNELWNPVVKTWFPEGKDNPYICLIKVVPEKVYYWDSGTNQCIRFFKNISAPRVA